MKDNLLLMLIVAMPFCGENGLTAFVCCDGLDNFFQVAT
jgi:hypothetical protein